MENTTIFESPMNSDAEYEAAIDSYLREMQLLTNDMEARQERIEKMQAETRAMLEQLEQLRAA